MSCFLTLLLTISTSLFAQTERAGISGRITDPNGAVVPHAVVEAIQNDTNVKTTTETNADGLYYLAALRPGSYRIVVSKDGFQQVIQANVLLHVQDELTLNFALRIGSVNETVTITAEPQLMNTTDAAVSTVIDRQFVANLPLNGRSFNMLLQLTPGVVIAPSGASTNGLGGDAPGQFSVGGQRSDANNFTVDGVSANFGTSPASSLDLGQSGLGGIQALSALGGTSSLVSVDALEEFRIETSSFSPEFGRSPGGQVLLTTRSGTNQLHGGVFEYFRNDVFDANDWFANTLPGSPHAPERHNDFGTFVGGPIWKDKTFFFFSYEGARLRLPNSRRNMVPSTFARSSASAALAPFLNIYPQPNGQAASPTALTAPFTAVWSDQGTLNATSLRIDHNFNDRFSVFARYNYAPSQLVTRSVGLNVVDTIPGNVQTGTVGINMFFGQISNTIRANYSTQGAGNSHRLDSFGGAVPPSSSLFLGTSPADASFIFFNLSGVTLRDGSNVENRTKQFNIVDTLAASTGSHALKFGVDYRLLDFDANLNHDTVFYSPGTVAQLLASGMSRRLRVTTFAEGQLRSQALSLFAQDTWKLNTRLTLTYGIRWELAPPPTALSGTVLAAWSNTDNPAQIAIQPAGTPLWKTTYGNFAPRLGLAYRLTDAGDLVLRAGGGIFYDLGSGAASELINEWPNRAAKVTFNVPLPISSLTPYLPAPSAFQPPYGGGPGYFSGFASNLKLPRSYQWNLALEKSFAGRQVLSATYVGQSGSDLLRSEALVQPNANFAPNSELLLTNNSAHSNYHAVQLQYRRALTRGVQALFNYTWSHSIDNSSADNAAFFSNTLVPLSQHGDKGNSDFDVRHSVSGAVTYSIPSPRTFKPLQYVTQGWSIDGIVVARSGIPFNALLGLESVDPNVNVFSRPDRVPGQPVWVSAPSAPGGKMLNVNAFSAPSPIRQGTEGRNDIPGFGFTQLDLSLGRKFQFTERFNLQFRADAFNVFNHPNFTNPVGLYEFGEIQSSMMLNRGLGGLNPLFQEGGPRSLQLSLKLTF